MLMAMISLAGLFIGIYLTLYKLGFIGTLVCGVSSCEKVQSSRWSEFIGVPVATWGGGFYAMMLVLTMASLQERFAESRGLSLAMFVLAGWGLLFTAWLNYLEGFVLHAWCMWCIISACLVVVLFLLAWLDWVDTKALEQDAASS
jgi:uncharacterized membrane protein